MIATGLQAAQSAYPYVVGGAQSLLHQIAPSVRAVVNPQNIVERAVQLITLKSLSKDLQNYLKERTKAAVYNKVRKTVNELGKEMEHYARYIPNFFHGKYKDQIERNFNLIEKFDLSKDVLVKRLTNIKDKMKKKAERFYDISSALIDPKKSQRLNDEELQKFFKNLPHKVEATEPVDFDYEASSLLLNDPLYNNETALAEREKEKEQEFLVPVSQASKRKRGKGNSLDDASDLVDSIYEDKPVIKKKKTVAARALDFVLNKYDHKPLPPQYNYIPMSLGWPVLKKVSNHNRQLKHYNTFRAGRSNDYIPTQTMANFLKIKF